MGGDISCNEKAWLQSQHQKMQREMGEHKQVLQEGEREQQEKARGFKNMSLLSPT